MRRFAPPVKMLIVVESTALVLALLASAPVPAQPLTFWWWASAHHENEVRDALDCALLRWRDATCIAGLDVSYDAAHWVRSVPPDQLGGRAGWTTGTSWNSTRIKLLESMPPDDMCQVLTHEIGAHVLRRANTHLAGPDDAMIYNPTSMPRGHITQEDIDAVCSKQDCGCQIPEPPPVTD